jgi:hypothetical protein
VNNAKKLPDAFAKGTDSTNYKLLQLANLLYTDQRADLLSIERCRDIGMAKGKTLDKIGEMAGIKRNGASDEQYRLAIMSRIGALSTNGDCAATIASIEQMLGLESGTIGIVEGNASVDVKGLTLDILKESSFNSAEIETLIKNVVPAGVELAPPKFAGSLLLSEPHRSATSGILAEYPTLFWAWFDGQLGKQYGDHAAKSDVTKFGKVGLSGEGEVPESWAELAANFGLFGDFVQTSGTYEGGTLGISSGDDLITEVV